MRTATVEEVEPNASDAASPEREEAEALLLLRRVAQDRDREAYALLFDHFQGPAYNLAFRILGNRAHAEEAMQESLLKVWRSAHTFRHDGSPKGWVMSIVAHQSLRMSKKRQYERSRLAAKSAQQKGTEGKITSSSLEREEQLSTLRRLVDELPEQERQLLAFCHGAGMTHDEISASISMPRRTVSDKIQKALEALHAGMVRAGVTAVAPVMMHEYLEQAICSGYSHAEGLRERVLSQLDAEDAGITAGDSRRTVAAAPASSVLWVAVLLGAGVGGGVIWLQSSTPPAIPKVESPAGPVPTETAPDALAITPQAAPAKSPVLFSRSLDFNTAPAPSDFQLLDSQWHWVSNGGPDGTGCMENDSDTFLAIISIPIPKVPLLVTFNQLTVPPQTPMGHYCSVSWTRYNWTAAFHNLGVPLVFDPKNISWAKVSIYLKDEIMDVWTNEKRTSLNLLGIQEHSKLGLVLRGKSRIDNLKIQEIRATDLPDVRQHLAAFEKIEPAKRTGMIELPELKSARPGLPVTVEFGPGFPDTPTNP